MEDEKFKTCTFLESLEKTGTFVLHSSVLIVFHLLDREKDREREIEIEI